jgi:hypothetical protein
MAFKIQYKTTCGHKLCLQPAYTVHKENSHKHRVMACKFNSISVESNRSRLCNLVIFSSPEKNTTIVPSIVNLFQVFIYLSAEFNSPQTSYSQQQYKKQQRNRKGDQKSNINYHLNVDIIFGTYLCLYKLH